MEKIGLTFWLLVVMASSLFAQEQERPKQIRLMPSLGARVQMSELAKPSFSSREIPQDSQSSVVRAQPFIEKARLHDWFEITPNDESLYLALRRWAAETDYQLVWDAGKDLPVKSTVYVTDDIVQAVSQVMADTESSSYPLHACTYNNKVIRILHVSQSCDRK